MSEQQQMWDTLQSQMNAQQVENKQASSKLVERERIEDTPFTLIQYENSPWFITLGKYRIQKEFETKEEAMNEINSKSWNLIITVIATILVEEKEKSEEKFTDEELKEISH